MPIPQPQGGQERSEYVYGVCVPFLTSEGYSREQAEAICISQWEGKNEKAYRPMRLNTTERYRGQFRKKYRKVMGDSLDKMVKPIFDALGDGIGITEVRDNMDSLLKGNEVEAAYKQMYPEIGIFFAKKEFKKAKQIAGNEIQVKSPITGLSTKQDEEEEVLEDIWFSAFQQYVEENLGQNITSIQGDSLRLLQKYLSNILQDEPDIGSGMQTSKLQDKLKQSWINDKRWRINRIVRTETTTASNLGSKQGMDSTGKNYRREWIAAFSNTRDDHKEAHGQTAEKGQAYTGSVRGMMYPGDPSGGAANVVNCKCTEGFELIR